MREVEPAELEILRGSLFDAEVWSIAVGTGLTLDQFSTPLTARIWKCFEKYYEVESQAPITPEVLLAGYGLSLDDAAVLADGIGCGSLGAAQLSRSIQAAARARTHRDRRLRAAAALQRGDEDEARAFLSATEGEPSHDDGPWIGTAAQLELEELPEQKALAKIGTIGLLANARVLIWGPPGSLKTMFALLAAVLVAMRDGRALIVEGEGSRRALRQRLRRLARGLGLSLAELGDRLVIAHGGFALRARTWRELLQRARPDLVVLDPLITYAAGADENSVKDMGLVLRDIDAAIATGATVLVVHHSTKPDGEGRIRERGSTALRAWADTVLCCAPGSEPTTIVLKHEKERDDEQRPQQLLAWRFSEQAITVASSTVDDDAAASAATQRQVTKILGLLAEHGELTRAELRSRLNTSGGRLDAVLEPLLRAGRLQEIQDERPDSIGRKQRVTALRLATAANEGRFHDVPMDGRQEASSHQENGSAP